MCETLEFQLIQFVLFGDEIENIEHPRNKVDASLFAFFFFFT